MIDWDNPPANDKPSKLPPAVRRLPLQRHLLSALPPLPTMPTLSTTASPPIVHSVS